MPEFTDIVLGFDPGGKGAFGWSVCRGVDGSLQPPAKTGLADRAASREADRRPGSAPRAVAVRAQLPVDVLAIYHFLPEARTS